MSFRMRLPSADYFSDLLKAIQAVADEGTFKITGEGMRLVAMDPAHISMVDFELSSSAAEEYECEGELQMTVNLSELIKLLKNVKSGESLTLSYNDSDKRLDMIIIDATGSKQRIFTFNTLETPVHAAIIRSHGAFRYRPARNRGDHLHALPPPGEADS